MLPEAVGGYFWVVFTSHRSYGNTLPSKDNGDENGKLWVAALDIGADGRAPTRATRRSISTARSSRADNLRGFWVLDPCKANGNDCTSGDECCGGYCRPDDGGSCASRLPGGCSHEYEKCTTAADCCDPTAQCINGRCALPGPPR